MVLTAASSIAGTFSSRVIRGTLGTGRFLVKRSGWSMKSSVHAQGVVRQHTLPRRVLGRVLGKGCQKGS